MKDGFGRTIDYLRVSVTDRCDLRCVYCMPKDGAAPMRHADILAYEQIERLVRIFASLGVSKVRLTGGEPLVRKRIETLVSMLHSVEGIERIALTTNGMQLIEKLPALLDAGLDAINISIDTTDERHFQSITCREGCERVLRAIELCANTPGLQTKLNCVPTEQNRDDLQALTAFANGVGLPLRFIELMPIGCGRTLRGLREAEVLKILEAQFGTWTLDPGTAHAKCREFSCGPMRVGFISPLSHRFCNSCNRVRLTSDGKLKTCLEYPPQLDCKALLSESDEAIRAAIEETILAKPKAHRFTERHIDTESRGMFAIGG